MVERVLVVEDDLIQQQVLACFLESNGFYVETARSGLEAIQKLRLDMYHIVLMDYVMPDFDGLAAARVIRRDQDGTGFPRLIALTTNVGEMVRLEADMVHVFDGMIEKPWQPDSLLKTMRQLKGCRPPVELSERDGARRLALPMEAGPEGPLYVPASTDAGGGKARVLLIDSDPLLLSMFKGSLETLGYMVDTAPDRQAGLHCIAATDYQFVLSDYLKLTRFCGSPDAFVATRG